MRNIKTANSPRIVLNETCFSWVLRGMSQQKLLSPHLFRRAINQGFLRPRRNDAGVVGAWPLPDFEDIEFDHKSSLFSTANKVYELSAGYLVQFFCRKSQWLTHISCRNLYCDKCLKESMAQHEFPIWKQPWCYATSAYCTEHSTLLMSPRDSCAPGNRMWDCYVDSLNRRDITMSTYDKRVAGVIIRVQRWVQSFETENILFKQAVHNLYSLLLSKRTKYAAPGLAAAIFGWHQDVICRLNLSIQERLDFGVNDSDARQRSGALLLIGWLTELVSQPEYSYVMTGAFRARGSVPDSPEFLGRMIAQACNRDEAQYVNRLLGDLQYHRTQKIEEFLKGVNLGWHAMR